MGQGTRDAMDLAEVARFENGYQTEMTGGMVVRAGGQTIWARRKSYSLSNNYCIESLLFQQFLESKRGNVALGDERAIKIVCFCRFSPCKNCTGNVANLWGTLIPAGGQSTLKFVYDLYYTRANHPQGGADDAHWASDQAARTRYDEISRQSGEVLVGAVRGGVSMMKFRPRVTFKPRGAPGPAWINMADLDY